MFIDREFLGLRLSVLRSTPQFNKRCLKNLLKNNKDIVCYGGGSGFHSAIQFLVRKNGLRVHAVYDQDASLCLGDIPVISTRRIDIPKPEHVDMTCLVTITKPIYIDQIKDVLRKFKRVIYINDIYDFHLPYSVPPQGDWIGENENEILDAASLFTHDPESIEIFMSLLHFHWSRIPTHGQIKRCYNPDEQYFPNDIELNYSEPCVCGAYDGSFINGLETQKTSSVWLIEPDESNFKKLLIKIKKFHNFNIKALPIAVSDKTKIVRFGSYHDTNSSMEYGFLGSSTVQTMKLDDLFLGDHIPSLITMDIEGHEFEALCGAKELLSKSKKPHLAISVYHRLADLWKIPNLICSLNKNYKFYLRNYSGYPAETIMYAL